MKQHLNDIGLGFLVVLAIISISIIIAISVSDVPFKYTFTEDYISHTKTKLEVKIIAFTDSAMKHVNQPTVYNRYVDSANQYVIIHRYLQIPKK